jgi:glutaredoxin-like protein NrdH
MTKKLMQREGIEFVEADLEENPEQMEKFKADGILQAPIVVVGNDGRRWSGFLPAEIRKLKPSE